MSCLRAGVLCRQGNRDLMIVAQADVTPYPAMLRVCMLRGPVSALCALLIGVVLGAVCIAGVWVGGRA
jgi:hypothetical protein